MSGQVVQAGTITGDVNLLTGAPVKTRYRRQVERIAPRPLVDREAELAELGEFCTSPATAGGYAWWRADAWSGKSALLSSFVMEPPPGVRVVSFFVTARLSSQSNRTAFIDNLMEQLLTILGESLPPFLADSTREPHLLGLLSDAAEACRERGEQLVLLVDGLDEDRGVHVGPDSYSIASLLPARPPADMRVVVASRPHPPIPIDVPHGHPLRDSGIVRTLVPSPHAQALREEMERDLKKLLQGSEIEQDLLGLTAAAGGGLTAADLSELTGVSKWQVDDHLRTVTGRSFARRDSHYWPGVGPDVYLLGHEDLRVTALDMLGLVRLDVYRARLHEWARRYRELGWPAGTPEYLLRGYYNMLIESGDTARMIACATDAARHDRVLALSGGDAGALAEIGTALVAAQAGPDLVAMTRLAIHRDHIVDRNSHIPVRLPAAWAAAGQLTRAVSVAGSIIELADRAEAMLAVAKTVSQTGDAQRAVELFDQAEAVVDAIATPATQVAPLISLTLVAGTIGIGARAANLVDRAEEVIFALDRGPLRDRAVASLVQVALEGDDIDRAEALIRSLMDGVRRVETLAMLAEEVAAEKSADRAAGLLDHAMAVVEDITDGSERDRAAASVASAAIALGDITRAKRITAAISAPEEQDWVKTAWVRAHLRDRDVDRAEIAADRIRHLPWKIGSWIEVARAAAEAGAGSRAAALLTRAKDGTGQLWDTDERVSLLTALVDAYSAIGDFERAVTLSNSFYLEERQTDARMSIVRAAAAVGDVATAEAVADSFDDNCTQAQAWLAIAKAAPRDQGILDRAEAAICSVPDQSQQAAAWISLAEATPDAARTVEYLESAETVIRSIRQPVGQAEALAAVVRAAVGSGDLVSAERVGRSIPDWFVKERVLTSLAEVLSADGEVDRAVGLLRLVETRWNRDAGQVALVGVLARAGDLDRAEAVMKSVDQFWRGQALKLFLRAAAELGAIDRAETITRSVEQSFWGNGARKLLMQALAETGDLDNAESIVRSAPSEEERVDLLGLLMKIAADTGDFDRAETIAWSLGATPSGAAIYPLKTLVDLVAQSGHLDRAEEVARSIADPLEHTWALELVADAAVKAGDVDRLAMIGEDVVSRDMRIDALASAARLASAAGNPDEAAADLNRALGVAEVMSSGPARSRKLKVLGHVAVHIGEFDRAEAVASGLSENEASDLWVSLAEALVKAGDIDRAKRIAHSEVRGEARIAALEAIAVGEFRLGNVLQAEAIARGSAKTREWILPSLARVAAESGDVARAVRFAGSVNGVEAGAYTFPTLVDAALGAGDLDGAVHLLQFISDPFHYEQKSVTVARSVFAAGDLARADAIVRSIADPAAQAAAWREIAAITRHGAEEFQRRAVASALRLDRWNNTVERVIELEPSGLLAVVEELEVLRQGD